MVEFALLFGLANVLLSATLLGLLVLGLRIGRTLGSDLITAVLYLSNTASRRAAGLAVLGTALFFLANLVEFFNPELHQVAETIGLALVLAGAAGFVAILRLAARTTPMVKLTAGEGSE